MYCGDTSVLLGKVRGNLVGSNEINAFNSMQNTMDTSIARVYGDELVFQASAMENLQQEVYSMKVLVRLSEARREKFNSFSFESDVGDEFKKIHK